MKAGSIVICDNHKNRMTLSEIHEDGTCVCKYFLGSELHIENHKLEDLKESN